VDDIWSCQVSRHGTTSVVALRGEVDMNVEDELAAILGTELQRPGIEAVQVDLGAVTFVDSSAINVLTRAYNVSVENGRRFHLVRAGRAPMKILEMTGLMPFLALDPDAEEAPR
jgi:anti-sigma B factor antagonist